MILFYIFLFFITIIEVSTVHEYVPTLIWASRRFQERKNIDYLALKKVNSNVFQVYLMDLLASTKPLIVVFLEQDLDTSDFEWKNDKGDNSFPFLSKLTVNSRVDYFRSVESPFPIIAQLKEKGYKVNHLKPGTKFDLNEGELCVVEFQKIEGRRPEIMKEHDEQVEEIHRQLIDSGRNWISIYTARNAHGKGLLSDFKKMSPWHVEERQEKSTRALSLYQDEFTGFVLLTKGSLRLLLPSPRNLAVKNLENYLVASAKPARKGLDFAILFSNYSVTFHLNKVRDNWLIREAKLLNDNGDILKLKLREESQRLKNKCYVQMTELQSERKPLVKVTVSKYKFLRLHLHEESCKKPYAIHRTFFLISAFIISAVMCWNKILGKLYSRRRSKFLPRIKISPYYLYALSSKAIL